MSGPEHDREAERLLKSATDKGAGDPFATWWLEMAKVHAGLALAAATALGQRGAEERAWMGAAGAGMPARQPAQPDH